MGKGVPHLLVPSRGVQIRRGPELGELQLQGHARRVELGHGRRERLDPHGVPGGHAEEFSLHAVERDLPGLNLGMGPREENQIAELGVRDVGVGGADERGVGERQILTRAVCDPQHRHGDLWMVGQAKPSSLLGAVSLMGPEFEVGSNCCRS